jgi:2,4-dienoyl-CoA reductase-like NADH-dependent reductase (Old Yellow Enzyme family)
MIFSKSMTWNDLKKTKENFARAALLSKIAGFDAIEVHLGHGYLLSQFLTPLYNKRTDKYGGNLKDRLRFPLEVLEAIRYKVGDGFPILCKMNLSDDFKGGITIDDSIVIAKELERAGINALILSGGYTSKTPFYLMRGDVPLKEMILAQPKLAEKTALILFGKIIIKKYLFEENFFLPLARKIRESVGMPLVYVGGVVSGNGIEQIMEEGFDLIAIGRALIHDPEFVKKIRGNPDHVSECNHCNICIAEMEKNGVKCVIV